jgi:hypothetical protein
VLFPCQTKDCFGVTPKPARETRATSCCCRISVFFAFVDLGHLARFNPDSDFEMMNPNESENEKRFFPSGAIFFFAMLLLFYAALWFVVYWIMIVRS